MGWKDWVRLPSTWIEKHGLTSLRWGGVSGEGSNNTAALMTLTAIAHHAKEENGVARITYPEFCYITGLSRATVSKGLSVLKRINVVSPETEARSTYKLVNYDPNGGWAKLPARTMYSGARIAAFDDFRLRRAVELNALKLFFLFVARRSEKTNTANISYDKIEVYTGIERGKIKPAISFLASLSLIYVEHVPNEKNLWGFSTAYRIVGIDPYKHMGTSGRPGSTSSTNNANARTG